MPINAEHFLQTRIEGGNSVERIPVAENLEEGYECQCTHVGIRTGTSKGDEGPRDWVMINLALEVQDEEQRKLTGNPKPTVYHSIFLDLNENGQIDMGKGKNVDLGKARAAFGVNEGEFAPAEFKGLVARVFVKHTADKDTGEIRANVAKLEVI